MKIQYLRNLQVLKRRIFKIQVNIKIGLQFSANIFVEFRENRGDGKNQAIYICNNELIDICKVILNQVNREPLQKTLDILYLIVIVMYTLSDF